MNYFKHADYVPDFGNVHDAWAAPGQFWPPKVPVAIAGTTLQRRNDIVHALLCNFLVRIDGVELHAAMIATHDGDWHGRNASGGEVRGPDIDAAKRVEAWLP